MTTTKPRNAAPVRTIAGTEFKLTGVGFKDLTGLDVDTAITLIPEVGNPHDEHALAAYADDRHIGYVPRNIAARIAANPDTAGRILRAHISATRCLPTEAYTLAPALPTGANVTALAECEWNLNYQRYNADGSERAITITVPGSDLTWTGSTWRAAHPPIAGVDVHIDAIGAPAASPYLRGAA